MSATTHELEPFGNCDCCGEPCDRDELEKVNGYYYCEGCMEDAEVLDSSDDPVLSYC
mgnify:FL=1